MIALAWLFSSWALAAPTTALVCATEGGAASKPALVVKAGGQHRLFACAVERHRRQGKVEVRGFRVFQVGKSGKKRAKPLFESDLPTKTFRLEARGQELIAAELVWNGKENVPGFETTLSCDANACQAFKPARCVFEKPHAPSRRALEQIGDFQHGQQKGKVPPKKLIDSLASLAYSGDEDAQAVFRDRGALILDGAAGDAYFDHQANLDRLKKAGCL